MVQRPIVLLFAMAALFSVRLDANAQSIPIDDFNDGADDGWIHADLSEGVPGGPGIYDASSGAYNIRTTDVVPADAFAAVLSLWEGSIDPMFSNGMLRATVRAENAGTATDLIMRWAPPGGLPGGYTFGLESPASAEDDFFFVVISGDQILRNETFNVPGFPVTAGEDWIIEAGAIGDQITMKVWPATEPEPPTPQLMLTDTTYSAGLLGLASLKDPNVLFEPWQINGSFDNVSFTPVPEPSTALLILIGAGMAIFPLRQIALRSEATTRLPQTPFAP